MNLDMKTLDTAWEVYDAYLRDTSDEAFAHGEPAGYEVWLHRKYKQARMAANNAKEVNE